MVLNAACRRCIVMRRGLRAAFVFRDFRADLAPIPQLLMPFKAVVMQYRTEAARVLDRWRDVERQLGGVRPDSSEVEELQLEAARLRDEYQRLTTEQSRLQTPPLHERAST
jgi:hypothetical protein